MFTHKLDTASNNRVVFYWYLLSFNGGLINAGGFLATGRFVSHVTGFATLFGAKLSMRSFESAFGFLSIPLFFLLGSFLAGMLIDRPICQKKKPHFDYVMLLCALCLFFAASGGFSNAKLEQVYLLLSSLCLACGLQNGAITSSSGSSIRTTHLTGVTTDLGLGLARLLTIERQEQAFKKEVHASQMRANSILAFTLGSTVGAWIFVKIGNLEFIIPGLIALYAAVHGRRAKLAAHQLNSPVDQN